MSRRSLSDRLSATATITDVQTLLRHQVRALEQSPASASALPPLMLWGPPGIGKSTVIREMCREEGIDFIDIRLAQRDPVDIRGLPVPKDDAVHWLLSSDWPRDPASRGIILFDEITAADRSLQVAVYELILDRRLGSLYSLPDGWYICAAGNRTEDRAVAGGFSSALANRFCHLELGPDLNGWITWAQNRQHGGVPQAIHPDVIGFLRFRPECFLSMEGSLERGWPSPRSWERVSSFLQSAKASGLEARCLELTIQGLVGAAAGGEFLAFRSWGQDLPDVPAMLRGKEPIQIPERADARYALCAAAVYHLWHGVGAGSNKLMDGFFRLTAELGSDFATMALMDALTGSTDQDTQARSEQLFAHPGFAGWAERHGATFAERWEDAV